MIRINLRRHSCELPVITQPIVQTEPMCLIVGQMWWKERRILACRLSQLIQPNWRFNGHKAQNARIEPKTLQCLVHFVKYDPFIRIFVSSWFIGQSPPRPPRTIQALWQLECVKCYTQAKAGKYCWLWFILLWYDPSVWWLHYCVHRLPF